MKPHVGKTTNSVDFLEKYIMAANFQGRTGNHSFMSGRTTKSGTSTTNVPTGYKSCSGTFANKIQSFKTLFNQTKGTAKHARPTPTTLNSFANWINKGAVVQTCTSAQVARWAKNTNKNFNTRSATPTACKTVLCAKFGKSTIKAVCKSKTGSFLVATAPVMKGRTFNFPK